MMDVDALVVLSGDGERRLHEAVGLLLDYPTAVLVLSGGLDDPPFSLTAQELAGRALDRGVAAERIVIEPDSLNTREQAVRVVAIAIERGWTRLRIVTSPYHAIRAFLTFVRALNERGQQKHIQIVDAPLLELGELDRIERYREWGHVATTAEGVGYLRGWVAE